MNDRVNPITCPAICWPRVAIGILVAAVVLSPFVALIAWCMEMAQ